MLNVCVGINSCTLTLFLHPTLMVSIYQASLKKKLCAIFQTELSQSLQSLSEKAKAGTEFIQGLKAMTDKVHVSNDVRLSVSVHRPVTKSNCSGTAPMSHFSCIW